MNKAKSKSTSAHPQVCLARRGVDRPPSVILQEAEQLNRTEVIVVGQIYRSQDGHVWTTEYCGGPGITENRTMINKIRTGALYSNVFEFLYDAGLGNLHDSPSLPWVLTTARVQIGRYLVQNVKAFRAYRREDVTDFDIC